MQTLEALEALLRGRRVDPPAGSYSATLVTDPERATRKIMEEAYELCVELARPTVDARRATQEAADLLFHVLAGLVAADVELGAVLTELEARRGTTRSGGSPAASGGAGAVDTPGAAAGPSAAVGGWRP